MPVISVLMSVYNDARHLIGSLDSILDQSFDDFEFIIIEDGSSDDSWNILNDYATMDSRIVLLRNEGNFGLTRSLNRGLKIARGKYIARQDADDISLPGRLQNQKDFMEERPEIAILGGWAKYIDQNNVLLGPKELPVSPGLIRWRLLFENCLVHTTVMMRKSVIKDLGFYSDEFVYAQDYDLWSRASDKFQVANLPLIISFLRIWPQSVSAQFLQAQLIARKKISRLAIKRLMENEYQPELVDNLQYALEGNSLRDALTIRKLTKFIQSIRSRYIQKFPLTQDEIEGVSKDTASKLRLIGGSNLRVSLTASLYSVMQAQRIDLRLPSFKTIKMLMG